LIEDYQPVSVQCDKQKWKIIGAVSCCNDRP